jgi:hypothetical protein
MADFLCISAGNNTARRSHHRPPAPPHRLTRLTPPGDGCQPAGIPPDPAGRSNQARPRCRRRPSPQRWLPVPGRCTMMRPCVGSSWFRGVFRLPHTPHVPPLAGHRSRARIHTDNRIDPETACAAHRGVIPPGRGRRGTSSVPGGRLASGPPSLLAIMVSWIPRECPADCRTYATCGAIRVTPVISPLLRISIVLSAIAAGGNNPFCDALPPVPAPGCGRPERALGAAGSPLCQDEACVS